LHGEIWAAQQAGHAPALLHAHYRGLATGAEARRWFALKPPRAWKASNVIALSQNAG
jgi:hypothetical protein